MTRRYGAVPTTSARPTRLAGLSRWPARVLVLSLLLICGGLVLDRGQEAHVAGTPGSSDAALYQAIDDRVLAGENYYIAAAMEQRARDYPLKPFVTMRLPTLAWTYRLSGGPSAMLVAMRSLAMIAVGLTVWRIRPAIGSRPLWIACAVLAGMAASVIAQPALIIWHEGWAGLTVMLSLACWSPRRWWPSVLLGLAAALFRELALPYLFVMAMLAAADGRPREGAAWGLAIIAFSAALALHAQAVAAVARPGDPVSQGWIGFGGWRFDLILLRETSLFAALPRPIGTLLTPLALLGWAAWRGDYAVRFAAALLLWLTAFALVGRPVNFYWGLMLAPMLPIGLPLALPALRDLIRAAGWMTRPIFPLAMEGLVSHR